jgi:HD-like signal output (HDOD) protein
VNSLQPFIELSRDRIISIGNRLAPAAATFGRLRKLLHDPSSDLDEIASAIRLDPALTFHVIRLSNSVLFGLHHQSDSLDDAIGRVGIKELCRLIGLAATQQVCQRDLTTYGLNAARLWENAVATAAAAEVLATRAGCDAGLAYTAGLLRTLGRVIIDGTGPGPVYPGEATWPSISAWEIQTFGITSNEVTALLLDYWRFPGELVGSVRGHLDPLADPESNIGACVLNLSCRVAAGFGLDLPGECGQWDLSPAKLTMAGVTEDDLADCGIQAREHFTALCASIS